jgi:hypothetical protein
VAIAPFFGVSFLPNAIMGGVSELLLAMPNRYHWWHPIHRERLMPEHGYPRYATHAIGHMHRIARALMREARVHAPAAERVTLLLNAMELTVNNAAVRRLYRLWNARRPDSVELVTLRGLPPSHDVVEPLHHAELARRAFPYLLSVIDR